MGVFRTLVCVIVLLVIILFLKIQTSTLSPFLVKFKDKGAFHDGYAISNRTNRLMTMLHGFDETNQTESNLPIISNDTDRVSVPPLPKPYDETETSNLNVEKLQQHSTKNETEIPSSCYAYEDSREWWNTTHLRNIDSEPSMNAEYLYQTMLDPWSTPVVNQSFCHDQSRFLDPTPGHLTDYDWEVRLMYLGIYLHQHLPAKKDIETRRSCQQQLQQNSSSLSSSKVFSSGDYQCDPSTKYLVAALPAKGAGATFRAGAVPSLLAGLATGRVVIFVNDRKYGSVQMRSLWHLASVKSCPRGDIQCYFLPITPCVLTDEDVRNATEVEQAPVIKVLASGNVGKEFQNYRIVVVNAKPAPLGLSIMAEKRMRFRILDFVRGMAKKYNVPPHILDRIAQPLDKQAPQNTTDLNGNYNRGRSALHHAAMLYLLRPTLEFRRQVDQVVAKAIPPEFDPEWSFGIPIRASDKCIDESSCLTFDQYMQLAIQQYSKYSNETDKKDIASIVLTSEAASMMTLRHNYTTSAEFPFRFVVNADDVTQGTGTPRRYRHNDAHKVMLSTMAALKLQLMPKYNVANCCSSFHQVMLDLLRSGCGAVANPDFRCLQETEDPQFHVCCEWHRDERCQKVLEEFRKVYANNSQGYA